MGAAPFLKGAGWNNRINADVRHYKLENLDLAHPVVSWLRDNTSDQNSEILRMYSVDALKRLALPDERRTENDAHYFNEDVEVVKALNNIEAYAKEAQQQIEANMAELKELLARQALNNPQPSPMDTPPLADLSKIENLGSFDIDKNASSRWDENKTKTLLEAVKNFFIRKKVREYTIDPINAYKTEERKPLIVKYKDVIKDEAKRVGIPPEAIAGILWNEKTHILKPIVENFEKYQLSQGEDATIGIAQISPYSALVEKTLGFDPQKYPAYIKSLKTSGLNVNNKEDVKNILRKYYFGKIKDEKTLKTLQDTFKKEFHNNPEIVQIQVNNEINLIRSDIYSIKYLANLLNRVRKEKGYPKNGKWTDDQIKDVVHQYNPLKPQFGIGEGYSKSIYNQLPELRNWLG